MSITEKIALIFIFSIYISAINSYLPQPKETRKNYNGHVNHSIKQTEPCFQKRTSFIIADQVFITKKTESVKHEP